VRKTDVRYALQKAREWKESGKKADELYGAGAYAWTDFSGRQSQESR
jgi:hypothetical protein